MSIPSRLVFPCGSNRVVRTDLTDLALSMGDSVPTSRRPIDLGSMLNLRRSEETAVRAREQTSGKSYEYSMRLRLAEESQW